MESRELSYKQWRAPNGETGDLLLDVHWLSDDAESASLASYPIGKCIKKLQGLNSHKTK